MLTTRHYAAAGIEEPPHTQPAKTGKAVGDQPPTPMEPHEKMRFRAAAFKATQLYPGPVGQLICRELLSWEEFGYVLGAGHIADLVHHVMTTELSRP